MTVEDPFRRKLQRRGRCCCASTPLINKLQIVRRAFSPRSSRLIAESGGAALPMPACPAPTMAASAAKSTPACPPPPWLLLVLAVRGRLCELFPLGCRIPCGCGFPLGCLRPRCCGFLLSLGCRILGCGRGFPLWCRIPGCGGGFPVGFRVPGCGGLWL